LTAETALALYLPRNCMTQGHKDLQVTPELPALEDGWVIQDLLVLPVPLDLGVHVDHLDLQASVLPDPQDVRDHRVGLDLGEVSVRLAMAVQQVIISAERCSSSAHLSDFMSIMLYLLFI